MDNIEIIKQNQNASILVFPNNKASICSDCDAEIALDSYILLEGQDKFCMACADMDHLIFLKSGDVALTRRSKKYSTLSAVVMKFSKARKRNERQGLLIEPEALMKAELECAADENERSILRKRAAIIRTLADNKYVEQFSEEILLQYPGCPIEEAESIAAHACEKYSGRIGRASAAKNFAKETIILAVRAHIRHSHTNYDTLLMAGWARDEARLKVVEKINEIDNKWRES